MKSSEDSWPAARRGMIEVALATLSFGLWHSLLCSLPVKGALTGALQRRGTTYRLFFNVQALFTTSALFGWILTRPHLTLTDFRGWKRLPFWLVQAAALGLCLWSVAHLQPKRFLLGEAEDEPEAQGPNWHHDGKIGTSGPFRWSRHPLEWAPMLMLLATPRLKTNWLAFNLLGVIYSWLGALHEESRLQKRSPHAFRAYQQQVGFFFGRRNEP